MYAHVKDNGSSSPKISQVETVSKWNNYLWSI